MTPKQLYETHLKDSRYKPDPNQLEAIEHLERIYQEFKKQKLFERNWVNSLISKRRSIKGLYMWGGVGIGKTWLMDIFCECLPKAYRVRMHFHKFMQHIHLELKQLEGKKDPLKLIAKKFAKQSPILCFDEFFVSDIADAMLLAGLLQALCEQGITLIITTNLLPDNLYKNGLQRERFLPAIALIKQNMDILHLLTHEDYRLRTLIHAGIYYTPLNDETRESMQNRFEEFAGQEWSENESIVIENRSLKTIRRAEHVIWFNFQDLCSIPRSQLDYLAIAHSYNTVLLSDVCQIQLGQDNLALYLINLVDIFYDNQIKLIISSEVPIELLYPKGRFTFEFQRTKSRLLEMQSLEYLQKNL